MTMILLQFLNKKRWIILATYMLYSVFITTITINSIGACVTAFPSSSPIPYSCRSNHRVGNTTGSRSNGVLAGNNSASATTSTNHHHNHDGQRTSTMLNLSFFRRRTKPSSSTSSSSSSSSFKKLKQPSLQRGSNYGSNHNSTIPTPQEVASILNVQPTKEASAAEWQRAWRFMKRILPILHMLDKCKPADSSLNLACMWWKAISGNNINSPVWDDGLSYDILPSGFRWVVQKRLCRFYPRLHHANVELRTAFLDSVIQQIVEDQRKSDMEHQQAEEDKEEGGRKKIRLVCFGAGYDLRSIKLLERKLIDEAYELDLPQVVEAKQRLIGSKRLLKRRPWLASLLNDDNCSSRMPKLIPSDLNDIDQVRQQLKEILTANNHNTTEEYYTIFVFEGVMIYLKEGIPSSLLNVTASVLKEVNAGGSLCFADRLENIPGGDYDLGIQELDRNGWKLDQWCPKPGLARHMGSAVLA